MSNNLTGEKRTDDPAPIDELDLDYEIYLALRTLGELLPEDEDEVARAEVEMIGNAPMRSPMLSAVLASDDDCDSEASCATPLGSPLSDEELHILALLAEGYMDQRKLYQCLSGEYQVDIAYPDFLDMLKRLVVAGLVIERVFVQGQGLSRLCYRCYKTGGSGAQEAFFESVSVPLPASAQIAEQSFDPGLPV